ncbi:MAG: heme-binding protein [Nitrospirae bacterium]|nr:heme-binding protein [Nitrospirota bacterium]
MTGFFVSNRNILLGSGIILSVLFCYVQLAQAELPKASYLPLEIAQKIANGALKKCHEDGYQVSVVVVDRAGVILVEIRHELAGPHTLNSGFRKAFTAASLGRSTQDLTNMIKDRPDLSGLRNMDDRILILAGGLPIKIENQLIGGIGVGGAPGGNLDEACAKAGLDTIIPEGK